MPRAVVLLSGGLDSATVAAIAKERGYALHAITVDYGQRHARELEAAGAVAKSLGVEKHIVQTIDLRAFGGSALTADIDVPKQATCRADRSAGDAERSAGHAQRIAGHAERSEASPVREASDPEMLRRAQHDKTPTHNTIPITYVPARNTILLSFALAYAEVIGAADIFIGVNAVDFSGYPDCRPAFIDAFERLANLATKAGVTGRGFKVHAPLMEMSKAEIIRHGTNLGVDYSLTHSCYDPAPNGLACGRCDSCMLRLEGFRQAGIEDPARYVSCGA